MALEPEEGMGTSLDALAWNVLNWGYWSPYQPKPGVDRYKFVEPRHLTHVCDRWAHNRTDMLQYAFFNGDGYESWENIWGIWNQITPRDAEALRRISAIYRAMPELLTSPDYEPFTPTLRAGVYATRFPGKTATLWTIINRTGVSVTGPQIEVPFSPGTRFFDLWQWLGVETAGCRRPGHSGFRAGNQRVRGCLGHDLQACGTRQRVVGGHATARADQA